MGAIKESSIIFTNGGKEVVEKSIKKGVLEDANYAQRTFSLKFSPEGIDAYSKLAGKSITTVDDLANAIKRGVVKPEQLPIEYIVRDGHKLILNTRTSQALKRAGVPRNQWVGKDMTGDINAEARLTIQLKNNKLDSQGILNVRQSGKNK